MLRVLDSKKDDNLYIKITEEHGFAVIEVVRSDGSPVAGGSLLSINLTTHEISSYSCINPELGFKLNKDGSLVIK